MCKYHAFNLSPLSFSHCLFSALLTAKGVYSQANSPSTVFRWLLKTLGTQYLELKWREDENLRPAFPAWVLSHLIGWDWIMWPHLDQSQLGDGMLKLRPHSQEWHPSYWSTWASTKGWAFSLGQRWDAKWATDEVLCSVLGSVFNKKHEENVAEPKKC